MRHEDWNLRDAMRLCELLREESSGICKFLYTNSCTSYDLSTFPTFRCVLTHNFIDEISDFCPRKRPKCRWQRTFTPLRTCSSPIARSLRNVLVAKWLKPTTAEVSRLRCERDRSVAQGVIRRIKIREFTVGCFES